MLHTGYFSLSPPLEPSHVHAEVRRLVPEARLLGVRPLVGLGREAERLVLLVFLQATRAG